MGNHDRAHSVKWWFDAEMDEVIRHPVLYKGEYLLSHEPIENCKYCNIYGHVHGDQRYKTITDSTACVSLERWEYAPVEFDEVVKMMEEENKGDKRWDSV